MKPGIQLRGWAPWVLMLTLAVGTTSKAFADEDEKPPEGWTQRLIGSLSFTQTEFENYAEGGESSLTWTAEADYFAQLYNDGRRDWWSQRRLTFGQTKAGDQEIRKAVDRIRLESVYTWLLNSWVDPYVALNARTQFARGFDYGGDSRVEVSRFGNPLYVDAALGLSRTVAPGLRTRVGVSLQQVFVTEERFAPLYTDGAAELDDEGGCPGCDKHRLETGLEWVTRYEDEFQEKRLTVFSELRLFSQFEDLSKAKLEWENRLTARIFSFIAVFLSTEIRYDEEILKRTQLKEVLSVGLTHAFL